MVVNAPGLKVLAWDGVPVLPVGSDRGSDSGEFPIPSESKTVDNDGAMTSNSKDQVNGERDRALLGNARRVESSGSAPPPGHRSVALGPLATEDSGDALMTSGKTVVSVAVGAAKGLLSAALLLAIPVSFVGLYLAYLAFIPPCYDPGVAWYNCPPDPATTVGLGLLGLAVSFVAIAGVVALWVPRFRRRWGGWVLIAVAALAIGMWLILTEVP
jgi:hypothetical protein